MVFGGDLELTITGICNPSVREAIEQQQKMDQEDKQRSLNEEKGDSTLPPTVPRRRGRPKGSKTGQTSTRPLTARETLIKPRCSVDTAMKFYHGEVHHRLTSEHFYWMAMTPFTHLFCFPRNTHISSAVLHHVLSSYDENTGFFHHKGKKFQFVPEEVSLFMGLPYDGEPVQYNRSTITNSVIRTKYFEPNIPLVREDLEEKILELLDTKDVPPEDIVSLLIMYLFTTILFPQASVNVPVNMFWYVDKLTELKDYAWGKACSDLIFDHLAPCSAWCKEMNGLYLAGGNAAAVEGAEGTSEADKKRKREDKP